VSLIVGGEVQSCDSAILTMSPENLRQDYQDLQDGQDYERRFPSTIPSTVGARAPVFDSLAPKTSGEIL
jgi:hypothetical protein